MKFRIFIVKNIMILVLIVVAIILVFCVNIECNAQNCIGMTKKEIQESFSKDNNFRFDTIGVNPEGVKFISYVSTNNNVINIYCLGDNDTCYAWVESVINDFEELKYRIRILNSVGKQIDDTHWIRTTKDNSFTYELMYGKDAFIIITKKL
jgi:hypothetical protein